MVIDLPSGSGFDSWYDNCTFPRESFTRDFHSRLLHFDIKFPPMYPLYFVSLMFWYIEQFGLIILMFYIYYGIVADSYYWFVFSAGLPTIW